MVVCRTKACSALCSRDKLWNTKDDLRLSERNEPARARTKIGHRGAEFCHVITNRLVGDHPQRHDLPETPLYGRIGFANVIRMLQIRDI